MAGRTSGAGRALRRAFAEFLAIPTWMVVGFLLLAAATSVLDRADIGWLQPVRRTMQALVFASPEATASLLGEIAGGLLTITSITISLVLLAVQQAAGSLTFAVIDQFLRRRLNQVTFGFFVGLALYAFLILSTVDAPHNPVIGATLALLLTLVALYLLLTLLYTTVHQMRPSVIVEAIHDHALAARERQLPLVRRTRRAPRYEGVARATVRSEGHGFVVDVDAGRVGRAVQAAGGELEVRLLVSIGSYVAFRDPLAEIRAERAADLEALDGAVHDAIRLERQRDLERDPADGIEQLVTIAWTSVSTSKQNPEPGLLVAYALRDLLARWSADEQRRDGRVEQPVPMVYRDDVFAQLLGAFESLAVVASESMQHQVFAEVLQGLALTFDRLPAEHRGPAEDLVRRVLSALGEHVLTAELDAALDALVRALRLAGRPETAGAVQAARAELAASIGKLGSRATRVPSGG